MTITAAQHAMIQRLLDAPDRPPIGLPNRPAPAIPAGGVRWIVQPSANGVRQVFLRGTSRVMVEITVRVEGHEGEYATAVDASVAVLEALFAPATQFAGLTIDRPADPRPPLTGDGIYAVPVILRAITFY